MIKYKKCVSKFIQKGASEMTRNGKGKFTVKSVLIMCFLIGLAGIVAALYALSGGSSNLCVVFCVGAMIISIIGIVAGVLAENAKKACSCDKTEQKSEE